MSCGKASPGKLNLLEEVLVIPAAGPRVRDVWIRTGNSLCLSVILCNTDSRDTVILEDTLTQTNTQTHTQTHSVFTGHVHLCPRTQRISMVLDLQREIKRILNTASKTGVRNINSSIHSFIHSFSTGIDILEGYRGRKPLASFPRTHSETRQEFIPSILMQFHGLLGTAKILCQRHYLRYQSMLAKSYL